MDRAWMNLSRLSDVYEKGVDEFVAFAKSYAENNKDDNVKCPCQRCWNLRLVKFDKLEDHLKTYGIDPKYTTWYWHGESHSTVPTNVVEEKGEDVEFVGRDDRLNEMLNDVADNSFAKRPELLDNLFGDSEKPLYEGCTKFTRLSAVLRLYHLKASMGWSDKSFTVLLTLVKEMLPEPNELPSRTYDAKKILCPMGMDYKKIHACPNDCILYRGEFEDSTVCPKCNVSRYKLKGVEDKSNVTGPPSKVLWYLPIIPRFKRMFSSVEDARNLVWHSESRVDDDKLRHPADSLQWKTIDFTFPTFGNEARNLRIGLCTDGINPHGDLSSRHSTWPVLLVIYNLPPWLCMKRPYTMLTLLISGPRQPGHEIDVYLQPLINDLKILWHEGVLTFDAYRQESFTLRAMIFCTINDFPAYGNLSGYSVKGHKACPICEDNTCSFQLKHGKKTVYLGHRRFLSRSHPYRKKKKDFNGLMEDGSAPVPLTGKEVYERVKHLPNNFGKSSKSSAQSLWKKKSVFFDLPYWETLFVRHCIYVMHVEKNICESITRTLLNMPGKSKDGVNSRLDMLDMGIRAERS